MSSGRHVVLFLLLLALGATPSAATIDNSSGKFTIYVDVDAGKLVRQFGDEGWREAWQTQGPIEVRVTASYSPDDGESFDGVVHLGYSDYHHELPEQTCSASWGSVTCVSTLDFGALQVEYSWFTLRGLAYVNNVMDTAQVAADIWVYKERVLALPPGDDQGTLHTSGGSPIQGWAYKIVLEPSEDYYGVTETRVPLAGETLRVDSDTFRFDPETITADDAGRVWIVPYRETDGATRAAVGAGRAPADVSDGTMSLQLAVDPPVERHIKIPYAKLAAFDGAVQTKHSLEGVWHNAVAGESLEKGDSIFLGAWEGDPVTGSPWVQIAFCDGRTGEVLMTSTQQHNNMILVLGDHIETREYTMLVDIENMGYTVYHNGRDYARSAVAWTMGQLASKVMGPLGWVASKVGGVAVNYGVKKFGGGGGRFADAAQPGPLSPAPAPAIVYSRAQAAPVPGLFDGAPANTRLLWVLKEDGELQVINRDAPLVVDDGAAGVIVPQGGSVSIDSQVTRAIGTPSMPWRDPLAAEVPLSITPADGAVIGTLTPKITVAYPYAAFFPVDLLSLTVRANGREVTIPGARGATETSMWLPKETPLHAGTNTIDATITTLDGVTSRARATVTVNARSAAPDGLSASGSTAGVVLRWRPSRDPAITAYRAWRADTEDGALAPLGPARLEGTAFLDETLAAGNTAWYAVSTIDPDGVEGLPSARQPATRPAALQAAHVASAAPAVTGLALATLSTGAVRITFNDWVRSGTTWRVERGATAEGPFEALAANGGLTGSSGVIDPEAPRGFAAWYRVTPLGAGLAPGTPVVAGPVTPADTAPAPPAGVTVRWEKRQATVEWNPSPEADVTGYRVQRALAGEPPAAAHGGTLAQTAFADTLLDDGVYVYTVVAVDAAGHESAPSDAMPVSAYGSPGCAFELDATEKSIGRPGGEISVGLTVAAGCAWRATTDAAWITPAATDGLGSGTLHLTVAPNDSGAARGALVLVAGHALVVTQAACSLGLAPADLAIPAGAGNGTLTVTADTGCGWGAASDAAWLAIGSPVTGSGNRTVTLTAEANPTMAPRSATITLTATDPPGGTVGASTVTQAAGPLAITSPAAPATVQPGSNFTLGWARSGAVRSVALVSICGSTRKTLAAGSTGTNYRWTVPLSTTPMTCRIAFTALDPKKKKLVEILSPAFSVVPLAVTAPEAGAMVTAGASTTVRWSAGKFSRKPTLARVEFKADGGSSWALVGETKAVAPGSGSLAWIVPATPGVSGAVRVSLLAGRTLVTMVNTAVMIGP